MKTSTLSSTRVAALFAATLLCGAPGILPAQETAPDATPPVIRESAGEKAAARISREFAGFAGSDENATALVTGLRNGTAVTLNTIVDGQPAATEFQPATGKMGYGNVKLSLALARESLAKAGITEPTPAQIVAALNGGSVTNADGTATTLAGVLALRAAGTGWGHIAKSLGVKVGPVMRELHGGQPKPERATLATPGTPTESLARGASSAPRPVNVHRPAWAGSAPTAAPRPPHLPQVPRGGRP